MSSVRGSLVFVSLEKVSANLMLLSGMVQAAVGVVPVALHPVLLRLVAAVHRESGGLLKELFRWSRDPIFSGPEQR